MTEQERTKEAQEQVMVICHEHPNASRMELALLCYMEGVLSGGNECKSIYERRIAIYKAMKP